MWNQMRRWILFDEKWTCLEDGRIGRDIGVVGDCAGGVRYKIEWSVDSGDGKVKSTTMCVRGNDDVLEKVKVS